MSFFEGLPPSPPEGITEMRKLAPIFLVLGMLMAAGSVFAAPAAGGVGSTAAEFFLQDLDGSFHSLSDYRSKVVFFFVVGWG